jgi:hypothetical protein
MSSQPLVLSVAQAAVLFQYDAVTIQLLLYFACSLKFTPRLPGCGTRGGAVSDALFL